MAISPKFFWAFIKDITRQNTCKEIKLFLELFINKKNLNILFSVFLRIRLYYNSIPAKAIEEKLKKLYGVSPLTLL